MDAPNLFPELDDQLAELGDPEAAEALGVFAIDSLDKANWAVRKIAVHAQRLADAEAFAKREFARLTLWLEGERDTAEQSSSFLAGLLRRYHEARLAEDPKAKTLHLPAGDLVARKQPDVWDIDDETLLVWAEANNRNDIVRRPEPEVDRNAVKKAFAAAAGKAVTSDGDVVPGITVTDGETKFTVKPRVFEP